MEEQESNAVAAAEKLELKVRERTIEEIAKLGFGKQGKAKMGADAVRLAKEAVLLFVAEGLKRAAEQAKLEGKKEVKSSEGVDEDSEEDNGPSSTSGGQIAAIVKKKPHGFKAGMHKTFGQKFR